MNSWILLLVCLAVNYSVAISGSWYTRKGLKGWYQHLKKPSWTPSPKVFKFVWPLLYTLMAISLWWALISSKQTAWILIAYSSQLFFNFLWSFLFFKLKSLKLALADLLILLGTLIWTLVIFFKASVFAGLLFIPYVLWVIFAGLLNMSIYLKNKSL